MNWRTDKPTADVIVVKIKYVDYYTVLMKKGQDYYSMDDDIGKTPFEAIEKWADLEEEKRCKTNIDREEQISQVADILFYNTETAQLSIEKCYELAEKIVTKRGVNLRGEETATDTEQTRKEGRLQYWLEYFGMPKENIENCITQIAQGYGACRYLEGVQHGAEAVNELAKETPTPEQAMQSLDEKIKSAKKSWEGVDADEYLDEVRGREKTVKDYKELEEEIDRAIDDLEGVAEKSSNGELIAHLTPIEHLKDFARHFAKWGAEHLKR